MMLLAKVLFLLLVGPALCFIHDHQTFHRERHVRQAESSTLHAPVHASYPDSTAEFTMREASNNDTSTVIDFLDQLRKFHDILLDDDAATKGSTSRSVAPLIKDGDTIQSLMPQLRNCHVILAQPTSAGDTVPGSASSQPIGFASYHLRYTGFGPPLMHMEHLFVSSKCRSQGAGLALMNELANIGRQYHCSHMEWSVHKENIRGVQFYHRIGAVTHTIQHPPRVMMDPIKSPQYSSKSHVETSNTMKWIPAAWSL